MSKINEKLGLRTAGRRPMMRNLPADRAERARLTGARCPKCNNTGALASRSKPGSLICSWCLTIWEPTL